MRYHFLRSVLKLSPLALACVSAFGQYQGDYQQAPQYQSQDYAQDANDVPGRSVARISWMAGDVSVRRGDSGQTVAAAINAPLMVEDYVATALGGRAEVQLDYAQRARLGPDAEMRISALEADHCQLQLSRGVLSYSVLRNPPAQAEISTPSVSVHPLGQGNFRVWVREDGETTITVRSGEVEVSTPRGTERLHRGQSMLVRGNPQDPEYQLMAAQGGDEWDNWNDRRDRDLERSSSYRYVSQDIAGAEDLDAYGRWDNDPQYGQVWVPQVAADWAPYRAGRWAWEDYYGWTWVSSEPWGWAPYHYGNWYRNASFGWAWYPGQFRERHFWRPAVVGFFGFGDGGFDLNAGFGNVGWCPLAPFETYHPWYGRGGYGGYGNNSYTNINIVNNTNINNFYRNAQYGSTSVNAGQFLNGGARYARVPGDQLQNAALMRGQLPFTPTANNLRFSNRQTIAIPRTNFQNSRFYSRNPGMQQNNVRVPFQQQQQLMQQAQQAFTRQSNTPGVRYGGAQNNGMNQRAPQQFGGQPGVQNSQPYARPGYGNGNMNQRAPQQFGGQPGTQNGQPYARPSYGNGNLSPRPPQNGPSNWSRFGQPNGAGAGNSNAPRAVNPGTGWSGYGNNQRTPDNYQQQRSLQLSQPMVQQRPQQMYSAPQRPSYNAPAYQQRPQQMYSAPQPSARPSYSAPVYQPRPQQTYSAPAYRNAPAYQQRPQQTYSAPAYRQEQARPSYNPPAYRQQQYSAPPQRPQPSYQAPPAQNREQDRRQNH